MASSSFFYRLDETAHEVCALLNKHIYDYNAQNKRWEPDRLRIFQVKENKVIIFHNQFRDYCENVKNYLLIAFTYSARMAKLSDQEAEIFKKEMEKNLNIRSTSSTSYELFLENLESTKELLIKHFVSPKVTQLMGELLDTHDEAVEDVLFGSQVRK